MTNSNSFEDNITIINMNIITTQNKTNGNFKEVNSVRFDDIDCCSVLFHKKQTLGNQAAPLA